ncbi:serpin B3-like isoform X1 [Sceloporus undulatus]|uniref:serpin B3-like isoform X1 n=1 Tax=Sceloporus undulatus TaxID=8520 RepID=UPI001C4A78EA|nr:serpin B3-like isoform X1 [Sceloporus undulatus]XP_042322264.1 serpin B3-like isoform X1 [Sceloporus undulatus]
MTTMPEANAKFAVDCYQSVRKEHPCDNLLLSPVNATSALGLLALASGCEQAAEIEKVLHWDELKECIGSLSRRYLGASRSFGQSATRLKAQQKVNICPRPEPECPKPRQRPEPTCPKQRPCPEPCRPRPRPCPEPRERPEPTCPRPRPCPEPARPEPTCPRPRPCPEPAHPEPTCPRPRPRPEPVCPSEPPCPERCVPDYECETPEGVHTAFSKILAALNAPSTNYTLSFANKLYGDYAIAFIQKFIYCALKLYWTDVEGADFHNAPEEVRRIINLWVEVQTHGKIKNLLPKDSFDCLVQLLLVNGLYFKGQWQVKFDKDLTVEAPFYPHYADQRDCYTVQLMNRKGTYNTGTFDICDTEVQVLEVPYKDDEFSFFVLLPTDCSPEALEQLEDGLSHEHLLDLSCHLKPAEVDVFIPKFTMEKSYYLSEYLDLHDLSDPEKADFSQATTTEGVALTQLVHDAFLEIDEEGGEEAEAPRCPRDRRPRREALEFVANHPFLYFVHHNCTQSIIALGKFAKPQ